MRTPTEIETAFAPSAELSRADTYYLVGIGGAGMSALARLLVARGHTVCGFDRTESAVIKDLRRVGIPVDLRTPHESALDGAAVVVSDAIDLDEDAVVQLARRLGRPLFRRSQLLGWIVRDRKTIAVTGTHGKTSTAAMIGVALQAAGLDPVVVIGAEAPELGGACRDGEGEWAVVEACEAYDSLRDIDPFVAVVTNLEPDHLDFHGAWEGLRDTVHRFLARVPEDGAVVHDASDSGSQEALRDITAQRHAFQALSSGRLVGRVNRLNGGAALATCQAIGLDSARLGMARSAIEGFRGVNRRLQEFPVPGLHLYVDYAHHPTEIAACLDTLRELHPGSRLVAVFQPHLYSRTIDLLEGFKRSLESADSIVLTDIYPAREAPRPGVSSALLAEGLSKPVAYVPSRLLLPMRLPALLRTGDVCVLLGAGNIADVAPALVKALTPRDRVSVAVIHGGDSTEREVSLHSGREVAAALTRRGYEVRAVDVTEWLLGGGEPDTWRGEQRPDVAFLAVHGTRAEDGSLQGFFELLHLPYTGSGVQSSALCMDKQRTKEVLSAAGLPVPRGVALSSIEALADVPSGERFVVKPNAQGSTVGLTFVESRAELQAAVEYALSFDQVALVEEWLQGMEISVPVLGDRALPVVEIVPASGRYDFSAKYTPGATEEVCPARLPEEVARRAQELALAAHQAMGCRGATRTDMIVTPAGEPIILEVNTLPGLTPTSLLPKSAATAGIAFDELCDWMVKEALQRGARTT